MSTDDQRNVIQRVARQSVHEPGRLYRVLFAFAAGFFLLMALFPLYWLFALALTPNKRIENMGLLPNGFNPGAFVTVFERVPLHLYMFNSIVIALIATVLIVLVGSFAGYAFGRYDFPGRTPLLLGVLVISYFPPATFLIPLFQLFTGNVGLFGVRPPQLFNTPFAVSLPLTGIVMPLAIYILTTFYGQIPDGLEDAARIEGSTRLGALFRIIIPLSAPGVATVAVLSFVIVYNDFFFSFLMVDGSVDNWAPILHGILRFRGLRVFFYNFMAAASLIGTIPMALVVLFAQEKIVSGLTAGALKE